MNTSLKDIWQAVLTIAYIELQKTNDDSRVLIRPVELTFTWKMVTNNLRLMDLV